MEGSLDPLTVTGSSRGYFSRYFSSQVVLLFELGAGVIQKGKEGPSWPKGFGLHFLLFARPSLGAALGLPKI